MEREFTLSGIRIPRKPYSDKLCNAILSRIPDMRKVFDKGYPDDVDHDNQLYKSTRYHDDMRVIHVLESNIEEKYLDQSRLDNHILAILKDAANADYYYRFEKDYGTPEPETDDVE